MVLNGTIDQVLSAFDMVTEVGRGIVLALSLSLSCSLALLLSSLFAVDSLFASAASVPLLVDLHALFDYPLTYRRYALATVQAWCLAVPTCLC